MQPIEKAWPREAEYRYTEYGKPPSAQQRIRFPGECDPGSDDYYLALAETWRERHPEDYRRLVRELRSERTANPRRPIPYRDVRKRAGVKYDHNLDAPMARLIMRDEPDLEGTIRIRASKADGYV